MKQKAASNWGGVHGQPDTLPLLHRDDDVALNRKYGDMPL